MTNNILKKNPSLNQFFNDETMGALDNYAVHEDLNIYITPLENDMFNDVSVSVYNNRQRQVIFPMNIVKTKDEVPAFFRELYNKIQIAVHPSSEPKFAPKTKPSKWDDFRMYAKNVIDRCNDARLSLLNKSDS